MPRSTPSDGAFHLKTTLSRRPGNFSLPIYPALSFAYGTVGHASSRYDFSAALPALKLKTGGEGTPTGATGAEDGLFWRVQNIVGAGLSLHL